MSEVLPYWISRLAFTSAANLSDQLRAMPAPLMPYSSVRHTPPITAANSPSVA